MFYAHYDGQPLDPKEWTTPPFEPVLRDRTIESGGRVIPLPAAGVRFNPESRLYARSISDDKAPIVAMLSALDAGFKRAFGTILDSHVTTLVAGALMFWLGSGPVKGFAVTLSIGVLTSLFSAILVTRLLIVTWLREWKPKAIPI